MQARYQIDRFSVSNFRSIQSSDVQLAPLTVIVGPNASGKSNFVEAISFIAKILQNPLEKVIAAQRGVYALFSHPVKFPSLMSFNLEMSNTLGGSSLFALTIEATELNVFVIRREECRVVGADGVEHSYLVVEGEVTGSSSVFPSVSADRVFLTNASGLPEFRQIYDFLSGITVTEPATLVARFASFDLRFRILRDKHPEEFELIQDYLRAISPTFQKIAFQGEPGKESVRFYEKNAKGIAAFGQSHMSAGFLHAAIILLKLFTPNDNGSPLSPVILEEPEALLHPGAINALRDSFLEASAIRQVLVTSHSPELLDNPEISADSIRSVVKDEQGTHILPLDDATRSVLRDRLYTAGELLRSGALLNFGLKG